MIDLHCHLLPGIDDGASSFEEAIALIKMAYEDGITKMVLTPHVHPGRYDNTLNSIQPHFEVFQKGVCERGIDIQLTYAGEVRLSAEVLGLVASNNLPFLGKLDGKDVVLLELPHGFIPPGSDKLVKWLIDRNILPMIAHPERNKAVINSLDALLPFVKLGCLFQLTAMSVTGLFGKYAFERSMDILEKGWATVVASDAHNAQHRPPILSTARDFIATEFGQSLSEDLFYNNPQKILNT